MKNEEIIYKTAKKRATFRELVDESAKKYGDKNAFIIKEKIEKNPKYKYISYNKLKEDVDNFGQGLISLGLKGKRIAIIGKNSYEWGLTYLTVLSSVGISVPLDKGLKQDEIEALVLRSNADCIVFDEKYSDTINDIKSKNESNLKEYICMTKNDKGYKTIEDVISIGKKELESGKEDVYEYTINPKDMAIILFTSGTTAMSKGVMLSQDNILSNIYQMECMIEFFDSDVSLAFLPFHHTFGSTALLLFLNNGVCTTFCDGLKYIQKNLVEYKVSVFVCVPLIIESMYKKIMQEVKKQGKEKLIKTAGKIANSLNKIHIDIRRKLFKAILDQLGGHVRFVVSGAAALDPNVAKGFSTFGVTVIQGYGLTETSPVLASENIRHIAPGTVGVPMHGVEIEIDEPDEKGIGEIKAKGDNVMLGYFENEKATKEVMEGGWFKTGDLARIDEEGYIFICGRKKSVIVLKNGKNIFPEEIENLVNRIEGVNESFIFGKQMSEDKNDIKINVKVVIDKKRITEAYKVETEEQIRKAISEKIKEINRSMPQYKAIRGIILTEEPLIKTTTNKIKRQANLDIINKQLEKENV